MDLPTLPPDGETRLVVPAAGQHSCRRSGSRRRKHRAHPATRNQTDQPDGTNTNPPDPNTNPPDPNTNPSGVVGAADPDGVERGEDPSDPCAQQGRHYAAAGPPHTPAHPHLPTHTCTLATPHSSPKQVGPHTRPSTPSHSHLHPRHSTLLSPRGSTRSRGDNQNSKLKNVLQQVTRSRLPTSLPPLPPLTVHISPLPPPRSHRPAHASPPTHLLRKGNCPRLRPGRAFTREWCPPTPSQSPPPRETTCQSSWAPSSGRFSRSPSRCASEGSAVNGGSVL